MHHLNNIRFLFNDSGFMILTYPEVDFPKGDNNRMPKLINYERKINSKELFDNLFQSILWVSYRRGFSPLYSNSIKFNANQIANKGVP